MRWKLSAGVLVALAFMIPAAPTVAQAQVPGQDAACQTVERQVYKDLRELVTIDLDTATDTEVRVLANQLMAEAKREQLPVVPDAIQKRLDGTADDLRAFLKTDLVSAWLPALRIEAYRTLTDAGTNVQDAAKKALDDGTVDVLLAYLNTGLYDARALDCAAQPTPTATPTSQPTPTPSATTTVVPTPVSSVTPGAPGGEGGEGGGLPVTGTDTATVAGIGGALLLLGGVGFLIGRRRRSRFVA
ncbi:LPXTG cell wall anchor domain-containing protein [Micromonospora robiginosa]|uniref:LPXTG cell wall anchor domain-containing protein n=1 Tax=Micromonospora robiginosa TaxID=2749844 RepID=A0A7L6B5W1_9ACTN|nr:LPXTG cell wall anchor domain-containing protein [Micromonospora ferruginea]QLQ37304.1 LPXTG cell wall anchor domain-containing protein [Micromonospora ferruginea]